MSVFYDAAPNVLSKGRRSSVKLGINMFSHIALSNRIVTKEADKEWKSGRNSFWVLLPPQHPRFFIFPPSNLFVLSVQMRVNFPSGKMCSTVIYIYFHPWLTKVFSFICHNLILNSCDSPPDSSTWSSLRVTSGRLSGRKTRSRKQHVSIKWLYHQNSGFNFTVWSNVLAQTDGQSSQS